MSKDDYVSVTLGTFTFFVWALIGFMQWFGSYAQIDSCRSPHDMHGLHSSHSNMKTSRDCPGIEIGDEIGHPRNLLPNYPDRY
jgi:hypothetical protein